MTSKKFTSVWDAIEDTAAESENMRLRAELMIVIVQFIDKKKWTQKEAAHRLGITQPRISDLKRGKIDLFGLDSLVNMIAMIGFQVQMNVRKLP